jgi:hypothetical protein
MPYAIKTGLPHRTELKMAQLSIAEAIRQSPISKSQFYARYIDKGLITVSVNDSGKRYIDSSEVLRVFGSLKGGSTGKPEKTSGPDLTGSLEKINAGQAEQIRMLTEQMSQLKAETNKREEFYQTQIITLTARLEAPALTIPSETPAPAVKRQSRISKWWFGLDGKE